MSVKTISEGAHEKRLLHPSWRRERGEGGGEDRKRKLRKGLLRTEKRGRRERTEGWRVEREKRVGALVKAVRNADPFPRWPL